MSEDKKLFISFRTAVVIAILVILTHLVFAAIATVVPSVGAPINLIASVITSGLAAVGLFYGARHSRRYGRFVIIAWALLTIAQLSDTLGAVIKLVLYASSQPLQYPSPADVLFLLFFPLLAMGILFLLAALFAPGERPKLLLDTGIIILGAVQLAWTVIIELKFTPTSPSHATESIGLTFALIQAIAVIILVITTLKFVVSWPLSLIPRPFVLLMIGVVAEILTDVIFEYQTSHQIYLRGGFTDVGWTVAYVMIGLAGVLHATMPRAQSKWALSISQLHYESSSWLHYSPLLWVVVGYFVIVWNRSHPLPIDPSILAWGMGGIVILGVARQFLVMRENLRLRAAAQKELAERVRAEDAVRAGEARLRRITDNMLDVITEIGIDGTIHYASPSHHWVLGYEAESLIGLSVIERLHPDDASDAVQSLFEFVVERANPGPVAFRYQHADGHYLWMETVANLIVDEQDQVTGVVLSSRDATKRKEAEEALRRVNVELTEANRKLQELDKMKDQFVSNVSHELRTPHANIKLYLRLLERGKPEKYAEYMQTLHREVARLEKMIDDLLDLSRLDRGVTPIEAVPTSLNELLSQLLADRTTLAAQRGLTFDFQPTSDLPRALADPAGLTQVISNLVTNAVNYTPSGGVVTVTTALRQRDGCDWVTFTVRDTGQGISTRDLPHLFQRFYRGEVGRKATAPGTGLGLAISKELISRFDGQITIDSDPGHGAAFTVWLKQAA